VWLPQQAVWRGLLFLWRFPVGKKGDIGPVSPGGGDDQVALQDKIGAIEPREYREKANIKRDYVVTRGRFGIYRGVVYY